MVADELLLICARTLPGAVGRPLATGVEGLEDVSGELLFEVEPLEPLAVVDTLGLFTE